MAKCLCGCNTDIDASHSRGEPKRFVDHVRQQRYYRRHKKHHVTITQGREKPVRPVMRG